MGRTVPTKDSIKCAPPYSPGEVETICRQAGGPLTAYELLARLRAERPANAVGVYRSLDFLVTQGLVHRLETCKAFIACAHLDQPHSSQFLICRGCGVVIELADDRITSAVVGLGTPLGFQADAKLLEVPGLCARCRPQPEEHGPAAGRR
jgi:Fur family zinc uptake transcriptional regulator